MSRPPVRMDASAKAGAFAAAAFVLGALLASRLPWFAGGAIALLLGFFIWRHIRETIARSLRTAESVIEAIRNKDLGLRARHAGPGEPLAQLLGELNRLSEHLQHEHLRSEETTALLQAIVDRTEMALLAFDDDLVLRWTNPAADRLFQLHPGPRPTARSLGIEAWFDGAAESIVSVPGQAVEKSWELRRGSFWREQRRYIFFMVADSRRVRHEHERIAWQRLIRVIGHEVNNTLTPIQSLAGTSLQMLRDSPETTMDQVVRALAVIEQRAGSLHGFINEYSRLAKLPPLRFALARLHECVRVAVELERRATVHVTPGPEITVEADATQLEQALVNLIRNSVEASLITGGTTSLTWTCTDEDVLVTMVDEGPGIENPENLFVPFFSTKPGGSGIGLVLSRNIIEGHGGELTLANRSEVRGCVVRIRLPIMQSRSDRPRALFAPGTEFSTTERGTDPTL
jgi:two-component system, NtrC family, nitrogen regulation sensor histidine kinase NtrY